MPRSRRPEIAGCWQARRPGLPAGFRLRPQGHPSEGEDRAARGGPTIQRASRGFTSGLVGQAYLSTRVRTYAAPRVLGERTITGHRGGKKPPFVGRNLPVVGVRG